MNDAMPKILIVGSDQIFAIENFYVKYLRELGARAVIFPSQKMFYAYYYKNLTNKLLFKLKLSGIYSSINIDLIEQIKKDPPEIVWVFKGMEIFPKTLKWIRQQNIRLANYNPDSPFIFSGKGSGNKNVTTSIPLYDLHFTYNRAVQFQLQSEYKINSSYLPFGFDVSDKLYEQLANQAEIMTVCFVGNPDRDRALFIDQLAESQFKIDVYGHGWAKFITSSNVIIHDAVYGDDLLFTLRKYRVQLNLLRPHNLNSHNMRTFEIPSVGGVMVAPVTSEHLSFFDNEKEAFFFDTIEHCKNIIHTILSMSEAEVSLIRSAARKRSIQSGYSYKDRALSAFAKMKEVIEKKRTEIL